MPRGSVHPWWRPSPERLAVVSVLVGAWALFFHRALLTSDLPFERDLLTGTIPWRHFLKESLRRGSIPQWYPYEMFGTPFVGGIVPAIWHPQTFLLLLFSPAVATKLNVLGAFLVAEAGAYRAARQLGASRAGAIAGAFALSFGGYTIGVSNNLPYLVPLATAPWVLAFALRTTVTLRWRDAATLSALWALVFLGGDAQLFGECLLLVLAAPLIHGFNRRRVLLLGAAFGLAVLLASIELLPALYVARESSRGTWKDTAWTASRWALHPLRFPEFFVAGFIPDHWKLWLGEHFLAGRPGLWSSSIFAGSVALWLGLLAVLKRSRAAVVLGSILLFSLWMALGSHGGLLEISWRIVPLASKFRYPEKYLALTWIVGSALVPLGFDAIRSTRSSGPIAIAGGLIFGVAALLARDGIATSVLVRRDIFLPSDEPLLRDLDNAWRVGCGATALALVIAAAVAMSKKPKLISFLPALLFVELWFGNSPFFHIASAASVEETSPWAEAIHSEAENAPAPRLMPYKGTAAYDVAQSDDDLARQVHALAAPDDPGRSHIAAFGELLPGQAERVITLFDGEYAVKRDVWEPTFNICFRVVDSHSVLPPDETIVAKDYRFHVAVSHTACRPRAYVAGAASTKDVRESRERMKAGIPGDLVVWENGPQIAPTAGSVRWLKNDPDEQLLEVTSENQGALVVSDTYSSGWHATIDGTQTDIHATNVAVRGVVVPPGTHRVAMIYTAPGFLLGRLLCFIGLVAISWIVLADWYRREHSL